MGWRKVKRNAAKCNRCGKEIESAYVHDFRVHSCHEDVWFAVDGGKDYVRRVGNPEEFTDVSEYEADDNSNSL